MGVRAPAVVFAAPNVVEVRTVDLPDLGPRDLRIRTVCSGVSQGTERWLLTDRYRWAGGIPQYPHFPGYQAAGIVEAVGSEVDDLHAGDHVFIQGTSFAGTDASGGSFASGSTIPVSVRSELALSMPNICDPSR